MRRAILLFLLVKLQGYVFAQSYTDEEEAPIRVELSEMALIELLPDESAIIFNIISPTSAGNPPTLGLSQSSDNVKWLNYTSALSNFNKSRKIIVQITDGKLPNGIELKVEASSYTGTGKGTHGTSQGNIILTRQPSLLISGIKGCYTGRGINQGHKLTYTAEINDPMKITPDEESDIEITYTIADQ